MNKLLTFVVFLLCASWCYAETRFNPFEQEWEQASHKAKLTYLPIEDEFRYAEPGEKPRWNGVEQRNEFAYPTDQLKYNGFNNKFEYTQPNKTPAYTPKKLFNDDKSYNWQNDYE